MQTVRKQARVHSLAMMATVGVIHAWLYSAPASAAVHVVTDTADAPDARPGDGVCAARSGRCTLRAAVEETNATRDYDYIYVSTGHYVLERGALVIAGRVELAGRAAEYTIIDANHASRVLEFGHLEGDSIDVRLAGLTLQNGYVDYPGAQGGAILGPDPTGWLALQRCIVRDSFAVSGGGGIYNQGNLELFRTAIEGNESYTDAIGDPAAAGGGIYNEGTATIDRSSFERNAAVRGGGIANESGTVHIWNSTLSRNFARGLGGGLSNAPAQLSVPATAYVSFSTIVDNRADAESDTPWFPGQAGGIYNAGALQLTSSILARNTDAHAPDSPEHAPDCMNQLLPGQSPEDVTVRSLGGLVVGVVNDLCVFPAAPTDQRGSADLPLDPRLDPWSSMRPGEVTSAYEPLEDSPALDAAEGAFSPSEDQWGMLRPAPGHEGATPRADSGAVERNGERRRRTVMMVVGNRVFTPTDLVLSVKLAANGFDIVDESPSDLSEEVLETSMTLISETVNSSELPAWLMTIPKPILVLEPGALDELGMTEPGWDRTQGAALGASTLNIVDGSPIGFPLIGEAPVTSSPAKLAWGVPATTDAFTVAELADAPGRWAVFGYAAGARLAGGARAAGPRIAFFAAEGTPQRMNDDGWALFSATLDYLAPRP
ncbi:MAG: right-handed parallel beta-helix repeat-containing protein [Polyangiales bacterium]